MILISIMCCSELQKITSSRQWLQRSCCYELQIPVKSPLGLAPLALCKALVFTCQAFPQLELSKQPKPRHFIESCSSFGQFVSSIRSIFNPESYELPVYLLPLSVDVSSQGFSLTHTQRLPLLIRDDLHQHGAAAKAKLKQCKSPAAANVQPVLYTHAAWQKATPSNWEISSQI